MIEASVIMCVRNGARTIGAQLEALAAQECPCEWELVVVDNGSTDNTVEIIEQWRDRIPVLRLVSATERPGLGYARNAGAAAATGAVFAYCDSDDVAAPGWLAALVEGLQEADLVSGYLEVDELNDPMLVYWRAMTNDDLTEPKALGYLHFVTGATFAVRRSAFEAVGGWDERFLVCGDDVDLSWRIQRNGGSLLYRRDAIMHYRLRTELRTFAKQRYLYGEAEGLLRKKYADALPPLRWSDRWPGYRSLLIRCWHLLADDRRRGVWVGVAAYNYGRIRGGLRWGVVNY